MPRRRAPVYPETTIKRARDMYADGKTQSAILQTFELEGMDPLPHINSIKAWVADLRRDGTPSWSIASKDGGPEPEPDLVLPVLGYLLDTAAGVTRLTTWEAKVITRIRIVDDQLPLETVWRLTRQAIAAQEDGDWDRLDAVHATLAKPKPETMAAAYSPGGIFAGTAAATAAGTATPPYDLMHAVRTAQEAVARMNAERKS